MNRDDVIRIAREARLEQYGPTSMCPSQYAPFVDALERFAAAVYAKGHDEGAEDFENIVLPTAIAAEREACAKVCELWNTTPGRRLAELIRERSNAPGEPRQ